MRRLRGDSCPPRLRSRDSAPPCRPASLGAGAGREPPGGNHPEADVPSRPNPPPHPDPSRLRICAHRPLPISSPPFPRSPSPFRIRSRPDRRSRVPRRPPLIEGHWAEFGWPGRGTVWGSELGSGMSVSVRASAPRRSEPSCLSSWRGCGDDVATPPRLEGRPSSLASRRRGAASKAAPGCGRSAASPSETGSSTCRPAAGAQPSPRRLAGVRGSTGARPRRRRRQGSGGGQHRGHIDAGTRP